VRVTPFRPAADRAPGEPEPDPDVPGVPAAAPAPSQPGWHGCASYWVRLIVPVAREDGRLVVDARDETLPDHEPAEPVGGDGPVAGDGPRDQPADGPAGITAPVRDRPISRVPDLEPEEAW